MKGSSFLIAFVFAALTVGVWAWLNRPVSEPAWPDRVHGMAYSPFRAGQDPAYRDLPTLEEIDADLRLLAGLSVNTVRSYSALDSLGQIPALAQRYGMQVTQGVWLDAQRQTNEKEIAVAIANAHRHANIIRIVAGNETLLRGDLSFTELTAYLNRLRSAVKQPVSTGEPWHVWMRYPELADHVDFIAVHLLPYWEGIEVRAAVDYAYDRLALLQQTFPNKPVVIAEIGWPSAGRTRGAAVASSANQATFLRRFLARAPQTDHVYYLMEAFDQPWKARYEGSVGAYWGIYDVARQPKFEFFAAVVPTPQWKALAGISTGIGVLLLGLFYAHSRTLKTRGRTLLAVVVYAAAAGAVWIVHAYSQRYLTLTGTLVGTLLILGMLTIVAVLLAEAHEWAEAHWVRTRDRRMTTPPALTTAPPKMSIHVPTYNEPPELVIATLDALARLDYPDFEVLVIDNNTPDAAVWQPVESHCRTLGPRFRFFHVAPLSGYKAGALNFALQHTAADAQILAIIDSDYRVAPDWLKDLIPIFADSNIAIVQAPQDYRDPLHSAFKSMCYAEYRGFFHIGMVTRNERNAIIQHGTMTLVRRSALEEVGGWAGWCITEDAELGLRLFEHGYAAQYCPHSYGQGLMPDTFSDYKKQRFRWVYGAMQILRQHVATLSGWRTSKLTAGQRYHFIAGWLPWITDGLSLLVSVTAVLWSLGMIVQPYRFDPPMVMFSVLPLTLFTFRLVKLAHLYIARIGASARQTLSAAVAGLSLSHTVGIAVIKACFTRQQPFVRTPKLTRPHAFVTAVLAAWQEILLLLLLLGSAYGLTHTFEIAGRSYGLPAELRGLEVRIWVWVVLIQAVPYAAAAFMSCVSALQLPARGLGPALQARRDLR